VTDAIVASPTHAGKHAKCFEDVSQNDDDNATRSQELQERRYRSSPAEQDERARKQHARWHQTEERFK
jgi:hypothetical protein